ncbi:MAG TPA: DUF4870 domain-containing protein [Anaerolineae bacterium]|nr:DUF4870 domain-containing protein [Anaerolineae bacterium]HQH37669.1 DUF4870 domain-containing protein [Anaerolineae bacterium]
MNTENANITPEAVNAQAGPHPAPAGSAPQPLSPADERTWAMLAHLSVLLNLVTGFLGVGAALLIYLIYKDRSRYVAYQAMQAFLFQLLFWAGGGVLVGLMWAAVVALSVILVGILLIPVALILTPVLLIFLVIAVVYGIIGSIETSNGKDFRYWLVGDWALNLM